MPRATLARVLAIALLVSGCSDSEPPGASNSNGSGGTSGGTGGSGGGMPSCDGGTCTCPTAQSPCAGACVDLQTDASNCGVCGMACPAGNACVAGSCQACTQGLTSCSGTCVDTVSDSANCGSCGNVCAGGTTCSVSTCSPPPTRPDVPWVDGNCSSSGDTLNLETAEFCLRLSNDSQTVVGLEPKVTPGFDFTPGDLVDERSGAGYFHLGDVTLRLRTGGASWQNVTTSASRTQVTAQAASGDVLAAADLGPALPADLPLGVVRSWVTEGGRLVLRFDITNKSSGAVEIGALGIPMVFNNVISNRSLEEAHATCSFADPYIGQDAGYLQVTRLSGKGPALLVMPHGKTPFEAYNPILNAPKENSKDPVAVFTDLTPRAQTFEGFLEWMVHSKAYADGEWSAAQPWNTATNLTLAAGESKSYGVEFVLSDQIRNIEPTLMRELRPVAVGVPGYILPTDVDARLYLKYWASVSSIVVEPADAISITDQGTTASGWKTYALSGKTWGRSRVTVTYGDGTTQSIHYNVIKPAAQVATDLGTFLTSKAWFVDPSDPFGRSPSVMTYDHELDQVVTQSKQAWVCGLGDDGGATWLAGAMKLFGQPEAGQLTKYQQFVDEVVWGNLQYDSGPNQYGVKRTLFYYEPNQMPAGYYDDSIDWTYWGAWSQAHTLQVPRSYNYPHVAALYWSMYRLARNHTGLVSNHPWDWYLTQAYETSVAMTTIGNGYSEFGLMDGTAFLEILKDLQREGMTDEANDLEDRMRERADLWATQTYPFGSEMAWDSTGQEEVYAWTKYFGDDDKAQVCLDAITGYMPAVPHWGYNGCARRYWDFVYGGSKTDRLERMLHHYGSSLNAIPVLSEYRDHPDDFYLLRIGYAGMMGPLSNIHEDGFPSMAFHSFPDTMRWDPISGDYGLAFFGHAHGTGTYVIQHPELGWLAFGGNLSVSGNTVTVTPLDTFRKRVYLAPFGLWLTLDAGKFSSVALDSVAKTVTVSLDPADANTPAARLRIEQPATLAGVGTFAPTPALTSERDAYVVPLTGDFATVNLAAN